MAGEHVVFGAAGSGSVPVEAALTLIGAPYRVVELPVWEGGAVADEMARVNPMRQAPALILPPDGSSPGELMTESAAILIWLADAYPGARLGPAADSALRPRFLRWMSFIAAQVYGLYWIRDDPSRLAAEPAHEAVLLERTAARIRHCWGVMESQLAPAGPYLLGEDVSVLDLYLAVVSRWRPRRRAFYAAAPRLAEVVRRVDAHPGLQALWAERMPFAEGWEG